jgi:hypothetical protein
MSAAGNGALPDVHLRCFSQQSTPAANCHFAGAMALVNPNRVAFAWFNFPAVLIKMRAQPVQGEDDPSLDGKVVPATGSLRHIPIRPEDLKA